MPDEVLKLEKLFGLTGSQVESVRYTKGFYPFSKCCACCGYYLSRRALESDLKKL